jgi:hypothetical protein
VLLAITDLSPIVSALSRELRSNDVWNETIRQQIRQGASDKPGTEHLRPQTLQGFYLTMLQNKAEKLVTDAREQEVGERHLTFALVEMLRASLLL